MSRDVFYKYYDDMFHKKNYKSETDIIFQLSDEFGITAPKKILEIGCGTGNHTLELSRVAGAEITAIDIDPKMIEIAEKKLARKRNVKILETDVAGVKDNKFDLALAMFNVVNYISDPNDLEDFFASVYLLLNPGGVFVFDCWNGIAVVKDPPKGKITEFTFGGKSVRVILKTETDYLKGISTLIYNFEVKKGKTKEVGAYSLDHTLWTPREFFSILKKTGFEVVKFSGDWKMLFCVRKPK